MGLFDLLILAPDRRKLANAARAAIQARKERERDKELLALRYREVVALERLADAADWLEANQRGR